MLKIYRVTDYDGEVFVLANCFVQAMVAWKRWAQIAAEDEESHEPESVECLGAGDAIITTLEGKHELGVTFLTAEQTAGTVVF